MIKINAMQNRKNYKMDITTELRTFGGYFSETHKNMGVQSEPSIARVSPSLGMLSDPKVPAFI